MIDISIESSSKNIIPLSEQYLSILSDICIKILENQKYKDRFFSLCICDDLFISKINHQYRSKDYATDVLSFAFDDDDEFILPHSSLGEIIISSEKALAQAQEFDVSYEEEFARLTIHGLLHLLGYDHELGEKEHNEMFALQDIYMNAFMQKYKGIDSALI